MSSNDYTWDTRPAPGTLVRLTRSEFMSDVHSKRVLGVEAGELMMVTGYGSAEGYAWVNLILSCGTLAKSFCGNSGTLLRIEPV